jgi:ribosomal protein S18 acetylase RimI-like enzyme
MPAQMSIESLKDTDFTVRPATPLDAGRLAELGRRCFYEAFAEQTAPEDMTAYLETTFKQAAIEAQIIAKRSLFFLVEADADPAGYVYSYPTDPPDCVRDPAAIQLIRLYLRKSYYGRGVGDSLMQTTLEEARARGYQTVWLSSWKLNDRANAFYKRWEFKVVGAQKFTVGSDVQDDYIFSRKLRSA